MKKQTTEKYIMALKNKIVKVGYCNLQHLLAYVDPDYYTAGVYGWNSDVYLLGNGIVIVTGYRPFGNIDPDYTTLERWDNLAHDVLRDSHITETERRTKIMDLLHSFVMSV